MLLRMSDVITNGISETLSINEPLQNNDSLMTNKKVTASELCKKLVQFAYHLSRFENIFKLLKLILAQNVEF